MAAELPYTDDELIQLQLNRSKLPRHVAIIMDGNGRWAQKRGFPRIEGHRRGVGSVRDVVEEASRLGLEQLTLYCFSNENWKRPRRELTLLMHLLKQYVVEERREILRQGLRFSVIGRLDEIDRPIREEIQKTVDASAENTGMCLCLAVNYGARQELADAVTRIALEVQNRDLAPEDVNEATIEQRLYTSGMPDPDLLIRTANEQRISNFLLWQISYSELHITPVHWPEFRTGEFREALRDYASRDRRFGGLSKPESSSEPSAKTGTSI